MTFSLMLAKIQEKCKLSEIMKIAFTQAITYVTLSTQILPGSQMTLTNLTS
jgi:hypothetical protein